MGRFEYNIYCFDTELTEKIEKIRPSKQINIDDMLTIGVTARKLAESLLSSGHISAFIYIVADASEPNHTCATIVSNEPINDVKKFLDELDPDELVEIYEYDSAILIP